MYVSNYFSKVKRIGTFTLRFVNVVLDRTSFTRQIEITQYLFSNLNLFRNTLLWPRSMPQQNRVTASQSCFFSLHMDEEWTDLCTYSTHTQWSALCVLKWHKSFRTYDYSWGPTLCVTLSNIAAHISILTYFKHLSARSIEKAVVTFSMNRAFFRHCSEATFVMAILDSHASELFPEIRWSVHTWAWGIFRGILYFTWYEVIQKGSAWNKMA